MDARVLRAAPPLVLARLRGGAPRSLRHLLGLDLAPSSAASAAEAVEADAILQQPRADDDAIGVGCFSSVEKGYLISLWPDGYHAIGYSPSATGNIELLADGTSETVLTRFDRPVRLGIECTGGRPATIGLLVDGERVAETQHDEGLPSFQLASLVVTAGAGPATVAFDDVEVSRLD